VVEEWGLSNNAIEHAIDESVRRLDSPWVDECLALDPYWPKWDSPWWHMVLLWEMGLVERIPRRAADQMAQAVDAFYLHWFPLVESEVPPGLDPLQRVMCHCGLGIMYQVLRAAGVDIDAAWPWTRPWFAKYQLPDGGWNCDEAVYTKEVKHSSVLSTVAVLEALLTCDDLSDEEERMIDHAAEYMLARRLAYSLSKGGALIEAEWLVPVFPHFYDYDVLRGHACLKKWAARRGRSRRWRPLPWASATSRARRPPACSTGARGVRRIRPPRFRSSIWSAGMPPQALITFQANFHDALIVRRHHGRRRRTSRRGHAYEIRGRHVRTED
jgi:hypothetical protein